MTKQQITKITATSLAVATFAILAGAASLQSVSAEELNNYPPMVQRLAERFGLNADEVQEEFDTMHQERMQEREAQHNAQLDQLVEDGVLTQEQRDELEAMHEEFQASHENMQSMTMEERHAAMEEHRAEMDAWAEENNVDLLLIRPEGRGMGPGGMHHGGGMHGFGGDTESS